MFMGFFLFFRPWFFNAQSSIEIHQKAARNTQKILADLIQIGIDTEKVFHLPISGYVGINILGDRDAGMPQDILSIFCVQPRIMHYGRISVPELVGRG